MAEFNAMLLEGVCYYGDQPYPDCHGEVRPGFNDLLIQPPQGPPKSVYEELRPYLGQRVQLAAHHVPALPLDPTRWGGGSCLWESVGAGACPFGHHQHPARLFNVAVEGVLIYDLDHRTSSGGWWVQKFDGTKEMLPLGWALAGHHARVAAATVMAVEALRDALGATGGGSVEALGAKVTDLRDLVSRLSKTLREG